MAEEDLKAELTCPICMDLFREPRRLPCGHVYCRVCLQDMLTRKYLNTRASERILSCPECRQRYDLTFQEAGVDVFTRDFKLFRLVELFEKKFSRAHEDGEVERGATRISHEETAVKTVHTSERESSPQTSATAEPSASSSSSVNQPPACRSSASQNQAEPVGQSNSSPVVSLSDDSWVYVLPDTQQRVVRPVLPPAHAAGRHQRGDDSWLMPSAEARHNRFPVDRGQDVRGSASTDVNYRTLPGGEVEPIVTVTGRYDNAGPETFQRYVVDEPTVQVVRLPSNPQPVTSPSSDSSSESDSSDERGDEGSEDRSADDVSGSWSDAGSQGRNRRSRLSRFFRSLVMSDTDSYDEDDQVYPAPRVNGAEGPHHYMHSRGPYMQGNEAVMASAHPIVEERGGEMPTVGSARDASLYENGAASAGQSLPEGHARPDAAYVAAGMVVGEHEKKKRDTNHNSVAEGGNRQRNAAAIRADIAAHANMAADSVPAGAVGGVGRATGRGRTAIEVSDDSDDDYEPQTSMLRPKRKPRSRLKKFFTSLLSLSSSDEDDENIEGQVNTPSSSTPERH